MPKINFPEIKIQRGLEWCIYTLSDPKTGHVRYAGFSRNPSRRLHCHIDGRGSIHGGSVRKRMWIKKLLEEEMIPVMKIIEEGNGEWDAREKYWITHYIEGGCDLFNISQGGGNRGCPGRRYTCEWCHMEVLGVKMARRHESNCNMKPVKSTQPSLKPGSKPWRIAYIRKKITEEEVIGGVLIPLSEGAVKKWMSDNYGVISKVARDTGVSVQTAWYVALGRRKSGGLRVERALKALGCPLIQK